jgi:N-acetylmuramic acid 6-phosphate etherase
MVDPATAAIDSGSTLQVVSLLHAADSTVPAAVTPALPAIAAAVDAIADRLRAGGRLVYVGAGTSGRLATLDAAECPPTFGTPPGMVQALIAGGPDALTHAVEGAEDDAEAGAADVAAAGIGPADAVVGIAASGRTPYVLAAVAAARSRGAVTAGISCNDPAPLLDAVDLPIAVVTGPEPIAGSTRLKAGTAQKLVLNLLSTGAMIRLGKVHGNRMVDVRVTNAKLRTRAIGIVADLADVDAVTAETLLDAADLEVRTAVLMGIGGLDAPAARALLAASDGSLSAAIASLAARPTASASSTGPARPGAQAPSDARRR